MNEKEQNLKYLNNISRDIRDAIVRLPNAPYMFPSKIKPLMDTYDTSFILFQKLLPFQHQHAADYEKMLTDENFASLKSKKTKAFNRYTKEIFQNQSRFIHATETVDKDSINFEESVNIKISHFQDQLKIQKNEYELKKEKIKQAHDIQMSVIYRKFQGFRDEQKKDIAKRKKVIDLQYQSDIEQRNVKKNELLTAINEMKKENEEALKKNESKIDEMLHLHFQTMDEMNQSHDQILKGLYRTIEELNKEIDTTNNRIDNLRQRAEFTKNSFGNRLTFMKNAAVMDHSLKIKQRACQIHDAQNKLESMDQTLHRLEITTKDLYSDETRRIENMIVKEKVSREQQIKEVKISKKEEYEKLIKIKIERLKQLDVEISDSQMRAVKKSTEIASKMQGRVKFIEEKNKKEINELKAELHKIQSYLKNCHTEWESLRNSTQRIYEHQYKELEAHIDMQKMLHSESLIKYVEENTPIPDSTDFMSQLDDELLMIEEDYIAEEKKIEQEKALLIREKAEEDRSRGFLSTRKQNSEEVALFKETEATLKNHLSDLEAKQVSLNEWCENDLNAKIQMFNNEKESIIRNTTEKYIKLKDELQQQINAQREKNLKLEESILQAKADLEDAKERAKPKPKVRVDEDPVERENKLRAEHEKKVEKYAKDIEEVRKLVEQLQETYNQCVKNEQDVKNRDLVASQGLNLAREKFVQSVDRSRREIEYKYRRMTEEQHNILEKMEKLWDGEKREKLNEISHLQNQIHGVDVNVDKRRNQLNADFLARSQDIKYKKQKDSAKEIIPKENEHNEQIQEVKKNQDNEKFEFLKQERWTAQDLRMQLKNEEEKYKKNINEIKDEIEAAEKKIVAMKAKIKAKLEWKCPDCEKLEREIKDIKKSILDTVQRMHEIESINSNRKYTYEHFGVANHRSSRNIVIPTQESPRK